MGPSHNGPSGLAIITLSKTEVHAFYGTAYDGGSDLFVPLSKPVSVV